jgi:antitoxin component of RelBE/YafQ-DinJ toxin-antitoxin module
MKQSVINVRIDQDLYESAQILAKREGISTTMAINAVIETYFKINNPEITLKTSHNLRATWIEKRKRVLSDFVDSK